jgi:hypothetical protein
VYQLITQLLQADAGAARCARAFVGHAGRWPLAAGRCHAPRARRSLALAAAGFPGRAAALLPWALRPSLPPPTTHHPPRHPRHHHPPPPPRRAIEEVLQEASLRRREAADKEDAAQSQALVVVDPMSVGPSSMDADRRPGQPEPDDMAALLRCLAACFTVHPALWLGSSQSQAYSAVSDLLGRVMLSKATQSVPEVRGLPPAAACSCWACACRQLLWALLLPGAPPAGPPGPPTHRAAAHVRSAIHRPPCSHPLLACPGQVGAAVLDVMTSLVHGRYGASFIIHQMNQNAASGAMEMLTWRKVFAVIAAYCGRFAQVRGGAGRPLAQGTAAACHSRCACCACLAAALHGDPSCAPARPSARCTPAPPPHRRRR